MNWESFLRKNKINSSLNSRNHVARIKNIVRRYTKKFSDIIFVTFKMNHRRTLIKRRLFVCLFLKQIAVYLNKSFKNYSVVPSSELHIHLVNLNIMASKNKYHCYLWVRDENFLQLKNLELNHSINILNKERVWIIWKSCSE